MFLFTTKHCLIKYEINIELTEAAKQFITAFFENSVQLLHSLSANPEFKSYMIFKAIILNSSNYKKLYVKKFSKQR